MTTDYTKVASYDVVEAIWTQLRDAGILNESDYFADGFTDALIPIFPSQQIPEMNNLLPGKTYLTYDISQRNYGVQWWISDESLQLDIISRNAAQVQTISNFLTDLFRRYDDTAKDINLQLSNSSPFRFLSFRVDSSDPVQPFTDEGGYMSGSISFSYTYTRDLNPVTGRYL